MVRLEDLGEGGLLRGTLRTGSSISALDIAKGMVVVVAVEIAVESCALEGVSHMVARSWSLSRLHAKRIYAFDGAARARAAAAE